MSDAAAHGQGGVLEVGTVETAVDHVELLDVLAEAVRARRRALADRD